MNCLNCHRLHTNGNTIFCPFFEVQPCINGEHYIKELPKPSQEQASTPAPLPPKRSGAYTAANFPPEFYQYPPPKFIPSKHKRKKGLIDWESKHDRIFEMIREGYFVSQIAEDMEVNVPTLQSYLGRYNPDHPKYVEPNERS